MSFGRRRHSSKPSDKAYEKSIDTDVPTRLRNEPEELNMMQSMGDESSPLPCSKFSSSLLLVLLRGRATIDRSGHGQMSARGSETATANGRDLHGRVQRRQYVAPTVLRDVATGVPR